ncbi:MAG: hypothetical protein PVF58_01965 [Candidatus Methanofastidiosia archaeon]|jgi:hypothetical protein
MTSVEISNADTVRLIHHAFPQDIFETITIIAKEESFKIIGVDETSSIAAQMKLKPSRLETYMFDSSIKFPVLTRDFGTYLGFSTSGFIPTYKPIKLTIQDTRMDLSIISQNMWSLQKVFLPIVGGIDSLPQLPTFDEEPSCIFTKIGLLRLCFSIFENVKKINVKMDSKKIEFSSPDPDKGFEIEGKGHGTASTALMPYTLDVVSRVWELSSIEDIKISISQNGLTQFCYTFEDGVLEYVVTPFIED